MIYDIFVIIKKFFCISILIFAFCLNILAQRSENNACPQILVEGSKSNVFPGENAIFNVNVSLKDLGKLKYFWTIDKGQIIRGQGTDSILISTEGLSNVNINVSIKVEGLPYNCPAEFAGNLTVEKMPENIDYDCFGKISDLEVKARLDLTSYILKRNPNLIAQFALYYTNNDTLRSLKKRILLISNYLKKLHIPEHRFIFSFEGVREEGCTQTRMLDKSVVNYENWRESLTHLDLPKTKK